MSAEYKYRAFISYSHKDEKWASWLHKALETYRVPKYIVGRATPMGTVPARMGKVFRDREELSSSHSLGTELTQALEDSACQIVVCSPNAANSHWTNEEILTYKRLGRENRIFCLIVDGEPGSDHAECFPPALRYRIGGDGELSDELAEPIAADARPHADGKLNALLKLISGMLGVGFDALKRREHHRRQKRLVMITTAAIGGMVITSGLATLALLARNEANVQRRQAEIESETSRQTTEFMVSLFSVSDPSAARGNTITVREILDQGADRIEQELNTQPEIQAILMDTMGTVYKSLGLYPKAGNLLDEALLKRRELLGDDNIDVALTKAHLAEVLTLQAKYDVAEPMYKEALDTQRKLLGDNAIEVARTLVGFANLLTAEGRFEDAEVLLRESLQIRRAVLGEEHLGVAKSMEDLGMNLFDQGNYETAESLLADSNNMRKRLLSGSPHPQLADGLNNLALVYWEQGRFDEAESLYREALAMNEVLLDDYHPHIAVNMNNLAVLLHDKGDFDAARPMYEDVITARRASLGDVHPEVALALNNLAFLLYDSGEPDAAMSMLREAIDLYRQIFPEGHPDLASSLGTLGSWLTNEAAYAEAEPLLLEAVAMGSGILGEDHVEVAVSMTGLAQLYLGTERAEEAATLAAKARSVLADQLTESHWRTAWAGSVEGASLAQLAQFESAEALLLSSIETLESGPSSGSRNIYVALTNDYLAVLYRNWGKPDNAAKFTHN